MSKEEDKINILFNKQMLLLSSLFGILVEAILYGSWAVK
jgi:hypothetical protein